MNFGLEIKKIKLRENLKDFLIKPDLYNRIKVIFFFIIINSSLKIYKILLFNLMK
jgi:hypothetical protein